MTWTYDFTPEAAGSYCIYVRGVSGNAWHPNGDIEHIGETTQDPLKIMVAVVDELPESDVVLEEGIVDGTVMLDEVVGGTNQLWLGATSANYFARDIVSIALEERETPPSSPSSDEARAAYQNLPNVGVLLGGEIV